MKNKVTCATCRKVDVTFCEECGVSFYKESIKDFQFQGYMLNHFSRIVHMFDEWQDKFEVDDVIKPEQFEKLTDCFVPYDYRKSGL